MQPLQGRRALVTGAGMGIGQGIALELAHQGAAVAIHERAAGYPYDSSRGKAAPFSTLCLKNGTKEAISLPSHWKVNIIKCKSSSINFREDT